MGSRVAVTNFDTIVLANMEAIRRIGVMERIPSSELDDFVQDVVLRIYTSQEQLRDIRRFPEWVKQIARNAARDWHRKRRPELRDTLPDRADPVSLVRDMDDGWRQELEAAFESLDPIDRDILYSRYFHEIGYEELQARHGLSYSAVGFRLHRARQKIRSQLLSDAREMFAPALWSRQELSGVLSGSANVLHGKIFLVGGFHHEPFGEYDPQMGSLTTKYLPHDLRNPVSASVVVGERLYVFGGGPDPHVHFPMVTEYDSAADSWRRRADMPTPRSGMGIATVGGKVFVMGGLWNLNYPLAVVEEYDPTTDSWRRRADMPTPRYMFATAVFDGAIYLIGGTQREDEPLPLVEVYDPATDSWRRRADMPTPRYGLGAAVIGRKIYAVGGYRPLMGVLEEYDPTMDTWKKRTRMKDGRGFAGVVAMNGELFVIGGTRDWARASLDSVERIQLGDEDTV